VLEAAGPALAAAFAVQVIVLTVFGSGPAALAAGPYALGVSLAVVYGRWSRTGEYFALLLAGISPRRIAASVVAVTLACALVEALAACIRLRPAVPTEYAGYVLTALQLPLMTSLALPVSTRLRNEEPWALMTLLLFGYALCTAIAQSVALGAGWPAGLNWLPVDGALLCADVMSYREAARPRARL